MKYAFTGMLPGAVAKFEELYVALENQGLHPRVTGGYGSHRGDEDLRTYGVVCDMQCDDRDALEAQAAVLGITVQDDIRAKSCYHHIVITYRVDLRAIALYKFNVTAISCYTPNNCA